MSERAVSTRGVPAQDVLIGILERRLDNIIYRLGLAPTRRMARQMVSHGHFTVNGRKVTVPSYQVRDSDTVGIREGSTRTTLFKTMLAGSAVRSAWSVGFHGTARQGRVPFQGSRNLPMIFLSLPVILEYYSR